MNKLFREFWSDDEGAIISVELVMISSILIAGVTPGLVALRDSINGQFSNLANGIGSIPIQAQYDGISTGPASVGGASISNQNTNINNVDIIVYP